MSSSASRDDKPPSSGSGLAGASPDSAEEALSPLHIAVLEAVDQLGPGQVCTYGDIAVQVGTSARRVGTIMREVGSQTAWWKVVRADGSSAVATTARPHWDAEGIPNNGTRVLWSKMQAHDAAPLDEL